MTAHPWMPVSPCNSGCIDGNTPAVSGARALARVVAIGALLASFPAVDIAAPRPVRSAVQRRYAHALLRCCGVRLKVVDHRGTRSPGAMYAEPGRGVLVVSPHVGWTDILALAAVQPVSFVARADLIGWPVLGTLAGMMGVIPIDRARLRELPIVISRIADRISGGERIVAFPEGTTWCGRAYGSLRPALFQAAVDTQTPVQPVRLRYLDDDGTVSTAAGFVGDETMVGSFRRLIRSKGITAEVVLAPVEEPGGCRRELAARCERAVRGELTIDFADHGVLAACTDRNVAPPRLDRVS